MEQQATLTATEQIISQVLNSWASQNKSVTDFFTKHEDALYMNEVAPGRSRAIYLLGHLVAVSDALLPLLDLGEKLYPELEQTFLANPDKTTEDIPSLAELRQDWETVNNTLTEHFNGMLPQDWLARHMRVSEEDFAKEPNRNKLNVLLSRTNHAAYHLGQLFFLVKK